MDLCLLATHLNFILDINFPVSNYNINGWWTVKYLYTTHHLYFQVNPELFLPESTETMAWEGVWGPPYFQIKSPLTFRSPINSGL